MSVVEFDSNQLLYLISSYLLPLTRILGIFSSAPLYGNRAIPISIRVAIANVINFLLVPNLPAIIEIDPLSWHGSLIVLKEFILGISIGFVMRLIFTGLELAAEMISMTMGLGFATFFDPHSEGRSSALSQLLNALGMLLLVSSDLHLLLIEYLASSFNTLPIGGSGLTQASFKQLAYWGSHIFAIGMQLSLPLITTLLISNMALGILTRAAPQLNLFGIGFPVNLIIAMIMLKLVMPYWAIPLLTTLEQGLDLIAHLIGSGF